MSSQPKRLRLYCFAYAGGNANIYAGWQHQIDADIEICAVQLPGRGARFGEPALSSMPVVVKAIAEAIVGQQKQPFAFFGHSLGALLAFEVARYLRGHYLPQPVHLFVSGCAAPQDRSRSRHLHALPDDELLQELKEYNGTPPEIIANRALMDLILPTLRADFMLAEVYTYRAAPRLAMPITVFSGRADPHISETQAQSWAKETSASCDVTFFDGDHFFINHERQAILESVSRELAEKERV